MRQFWSILGKNDLQLHKNKITSQSQTPFTTRMKNLRTSSRTNVTMESLAFTFLASKLMSHKMYTKMQMK